MKMATTHRKQMFLRATKKFMMKQLRDPVTPLDTLSILKRKERSKSSILTLKRTLAFILNSIPRFFLEVWSATLKIRPLALKSALTHTKLLFKFMQRMEINSHLFVKFLKFFPSNGLVKINKISLTETNHLTLMIFMRILTSSKRNKLKKMVRRALKSKFIAWNLERRRDH